MSENASPISVNLPAALEALLFVSAEPAAPAQLAMALQVSLSSIEEALNQLEGELNSRGLRLQRHSGRVQLTTAPEFAETVETFLGIESTTHLSRAALETLSIIAYQQPVTRPSVDSVRGVNSDGVMKSLLGKGLIQEIARSEGPGRPILYGTTPEFLQYFGLNSLTELPPLNLPSEGAEDNHSDILKG